MTGLYTLILRRGLFGKKVLKEVKGHLWPNDVKGNMMLVIFADERRLLVNMDRWDSLDIPARVFREQAQRASQESQGQAKI
jgi:hypothetical protein